MKRINILMLLVAVLCFSGCCKGFVVDNTFYMKRRPSLTVKVDRSIPYFGELTSISANSIDIYDFRSADKIVRIDVLSESSRLLYISYGKEKLRNEIGSYDIDTFNIGGLEYNCGIDMHSGNGTARQLCASTIDTDKAIFITYAEALSKEELDKPIEQRRADFKKRASDNVVLGEYVEPLK